MRKVTARPPEEEDILELIQNLCYEDAQEVYALGSSPETGIRQSIEQSTEAVAIRVDGKLACITGVMENSVLVPQASPWLIGTEVLQRHPRLLLHFSTLFILRWLEAYGFLQNYVDARHTRAIAWLRHLGAEFEYLPTFGPYQRPFYSFSFGEL